MTSHDPVCGKFLRPTQVVASVAYGSELYHFCSQECHGRFWANPAQYAASDTSEQRERGVVPVSLEPQAATSQSS